MSGESRITEVTVYSDRALVTRELRLTGVEGESRGLFGSLPPGLIRDSVRVKGAGDMVLLDNNLGTVILEETNLEELNTIEEELLELSEERETLQRDMGKHNFIASFLNSLAFGENFPSPNTLDFEKASPDDLDRLVNFYSKELNQARDEIGSLAIQIREIDKNFTRLNFDAEQLRRASSKEQLNCTVSFRMTAQGDALLWLSYVIHNASWQPLYDGRLLYKEREFELISYADIEQATGEEWSDITLHLSTANPVIGAYLPEPEPWYVDLFVPLPPPAPQAQFKKNKSRSLAKESFVEEAAVLEQDEIEDLLVDADDEAVPLPASEPEAFFDDEVLAAKTETAAVSAEIFSGSTVKRAGVNVSVTCGGSQNIPTDGSTKKVFISLEKFPVEYEYIIMPAIEEAAYLKISMENSRDYPILRGPVKVFRDFDYVGDSTIKNIVPGEKLKLFMGIDDSIKVKRELVNKVTGKKGLTGKDTSVEYSYKLTVESYKEEKERVTVFEQVPVSRNKEIEIKILEQSEFADPDEKGILKMEFDILPGEKKEFVYSYFVRHPGDETVYGLA